MMIFYF